MSHTTSYNMPIKHQHNVQYCKCVCTVVLIKIKKQFTCHQDIIVAVTIGYSAYIGFYFLLFILSQHAHRYMYFL